MIKVKWANSAKIRHTATFSRSVVGNHLGIRCVVESFEVDQAPVQGLDLEPVPFRIESGPLGTMVWALTRPGGRYMLDPKTLAQAEFEQGLEEMFDEVVDTLYEVEGTLQQLAEV